MSLFENSTEVSDDGSCEKSIVKKGQVKNYMTLKGYKHISTPFHVN